MERSPRFSYSNPQTRAWSGVTVFSAYLVLLMVEVYIQIFENQRHLRVYDRLCHVIGYLKG